METHDKIARNPRLLFWGRLFLEIKILSAIIVPFYHLRGLSDSHIFLMGIVWSLTAILTEIPSGYLADRLGRKKTLLLGTTLLTLSYVLTFFAQGFWEFAIIFFLMSSSFSCFSGTEEALLYESLLVLNKDEQMNAFTGRQHASHSFPDIILPFLGAVIANEMSELALGFLIGLNTLLCAASWFILWQLVEPPRARSIQEQEEGIMRESLRVLREDTWLRKIAFNKMLVFAAAFIAWRIAPTILEQHGCEKWHLGVYYAGFSILESAFGWYSERLAARFGMFTIIKWSPWIQITTLALVLISSNPWFILVLFVINQSMHGLRSPHFTHAMNARLKSSSRATTLSRLNILKSYVDIPVLIGASLIADLPNHTTYITLLSIVVCLGGILLFPLRRNELVDVPSPTPVLT